MKNILITGANRGLGLEFVRQFLAQGDKVIACCRAPAEAVELQALNNDGLEILPLDVSNEEEIRSFPEMLKEKLKDRKIAIFINNAGVYGQSQPLDQVDSEEWLKVFRINTIAPLSRIVALDTATTAAIIIEIPNTDTIGNTSVTNSIFLPRNL